MSVHFLLVLLLATLPGYALAQSSPSCATCKDLLQPLVDGDSTKDEFKKAVKEWCEAISKVRSAIRPPPAIPHPTPYIAYIAGVFGGLRA